MIQLIKSFYRCLLSEEWDLGLQHNLHDTTLCSLRTQSFYLLLVDNTCSIL